MKKILTKEEKERKETRNKTILGLILAAIMIISTAGYAFYKTGGEEKSLEYNGLKFVLQEDGLWHFSIQGYEFSTVYNPEDTENISSSLSLNLQSYTGKVLYFSSESDLQVGNEIARNIGRFTERVQQACLEECEENLPVKNCSDNIIIIKETNETLIKQEENCVYILSKKEEMMRVADSFVFKILKIQDFQ